MKNFLTAFIFLLSVYTNAQQKAQVAPGEIKRPKLVIGIVIDQMRWDYLYRFSDRFSSGGFKRLMNDGFNCENTFIPYIPTYTAPGHTCIYTGSVPAIHGIISNDWYSREQKKMIYCTTDSTYNTVGSSSVTGKMSPRNLLTTTITDELRLATNFRSRVVGIALKDRGAIFPAGHAANAAYFYDNFNGSFVSSSYYMKELPGWVNAFNSKRLADKYLSENWDSTLYPKSSYIESEEDTQAYEGSFAAGTTGFPHHTSEVKTDKYNVLRFIPAGNTITLDMAKAAIEGESLGRKGTTDFLTISFSSTDYAGHTFGPNSIEIEDMYLRLDKELAGFFTYLDKRIGDGQYLIFLTADHGVAHIPALLQKHNIPADTLTERSIAARLKVRLQEEFNNPLLIENISNHQVFLSKDITNKNEERVKKVIVDELLSIPGIAQAFALDDVNKATIPQVIKTSVTNGYNRKRSGDIQFLYEPAWFDWGGTGSTHGAWYPYDAHIPLLWYGWGIKKGATNRKTYMTDIAATLAALLHIQMPNGCIGETIEEVISR